MMCAFEWRAYLDGLVNYEGQHAVDYARERPSLEPYRAFLAALGLPSPDSTCVIVGGSKGKGTTAAYLHAMIMARGESCGLYTSPSFFDICERIRVGPADVDSALMERALQTISDAAAKSRYRLSWFEAMTAAAFEVFRLSACRYAVLEVGLGGRLDATNVADCPVALFGPIQLEHTSVLGNSVSGIAAEKAAIMRRDGEAFSLPQHPDADAVLRKHAKKIGCGFCTVGPSEASSSGRAEVGSGRFEFDYASEVPVLKDDILLAVSGYAALFGKAPPKTYASFFRMPGRYQLVPSLPGPVMLDVAHTAPSVAALLDYCTNLWGSFRLLFACLADKDIEGILSRISDCTAISEVTFADLSDRRAVPGGQFRTRYSELSGRPCSVLRPDDFRTLVAHGATPLLVAGSFRLVAEFARRVDCAVADA